MKQASSLFVAIVVVSETSLRKQKANCFIFWNCIVGQNITYPTGSHEILASNYSYFLLMKRGGSKRQQELH